MINKKYFPKKYNDQSKENTTLKDIAHDSANSHVNGTTVFIDDTLKREQELYVGILCSKVSRAILKSIDYKKALTLEHVEGIYTSKDFKMNYWGAIEKDQPLLVEKEISYYGEPIAIIAATSKDAIIRAKDLIKVNLEKTSEETTDQTKKDKNKNNNDNDCLSPIFSIDQAIKEHSYFGEQTQLQRGNLTQAKKDATHFLKNTFINGGQEHFYLESHAAIAYPNENNELTIHCSSQHPTEVQHVVAKALGLQFNQVVSVVKRMGGGFGGKESQASQMAAYVALVAHKTKRSARLILNKDEDMEMTGKRHPFQTDYHVGFNDLGKIIFLEANLFADAGAYLDLSPAILQRAMFHIDNAYFLEHCLITGRMCKTNRAPNTAFRGFGGPQGAAVIENIMEEIAENLSIDAFKIRQINCYQENTKNITHYGQKIEHNLLPKLFSTLHKNVNYTERIKEIQSYNNADHSDVRGYALTPCKFGISFTSTFLNQGSALVNIHTDGTIQVSTGATEMGQGVNTKIQTIVSQCLGISPRYVKLMPTSTEKNHNTSATAASSGSDINGSAALLATEKIKKRLALLACDIFNISTENIDQITFKKDHVSDGKKKISFPELVLKAYLSRVSLGGYSFYKTPQIHFDPITGKGQPFLYFTMGTAYSEVSIDKLTGELKVLRTNILMDLGRPINKSIDIGQVVGAFTQALGWLTSEELVYHSSGKLLSHSPTTYKIPNIGDTPDILTVDFIDNETNVFNVKRSKAVGEPPFLLGLSVFAAIKNALSSFTKSNDINCRDNLLLKIPASNEEILKQMYPEDFL